MSQFSDHLRSLTTQSDLRSKTSNETVNPEKRIGRSSDNRALRNRAAHLTSKSDVMRACGRWPFPFLRNGDYLTPAFTDSPPCARFARRLAHSHGSLH